MKIRTLLAREVLDSRGNPTVEADVCLEDGIVGRAITPSGASTGTHEASELRDGGARFGGKGVAKAVRHVKEELALVVVGKEVSDQGGIDEAMIALDGTKNKGRLGANAILAVSLAAAKAAAIAENIPLFEYIGRLSSERRTPTLPLPQCNIINGGKHAAGSTDIQEFMISPIGARTFSEGIRMVAEIFHTLKGVLTAKGYGTTVGDEGGFAPHVSGGNEEALQLIAKSVEKSGYTLGKDISLALDAAASEFFHGTYVLAREGKSYTAEQMISFYGELSKRYPIYSIEDGLAEDDWEGWKKLTTALGHTTQIVGDDLLVTNTNFLQRAINEKAANAILIKPNQIGTLTETVAAVDMAHKAHWRAVISHRSGETEDTTIAHIAVGLGAGQIKAGSLARTDRTAKYNELLRIEESLGENAMYAGNVFLKANR